MIDLSRPRRIHLVGVGGPGMSAIALVLSEMGHPTRGSDLRETPFVDRLRFVGVDVRIGHSVSNLDDIEAVCVSTAIPANNLEVQEAHRRGIPVLHRSEVLAGICARARSIGVAGTHGKTTTTSMLSLILRAAGFDPSFIVGGQVHEVGTGANWTGAELLVVEADESDGTFLALPLQGTIVTNIEVDHLDYFGTVEAIEEGFDRYLGQANGPTVVCADDPIAARLGARHGAATYGVAVTADYRLDHIELLGRGVQRITVMHHGTRLGTIDLPLRGEHMARNAVGAAAMAMELGAPFEACRAALAGFGGVARRFDIRFSDSEITLVDDYAHLPGEIHAVLKAAASSGDGWRRVVAVFQPNRFSRMEVLSPDYGDAFEFADLVVLTDIYGSGEAPRPGVTGKLVVNSVLDKHPYARVMYLPNRKDLVVTVARELRAGDVCVSMGCGDIASFPDEVALERSGQRR